MAQQFIDYIQFGILPDNPREKVSIRRWAPRFHFDVQTKVLYKKLYDGILLRCLSYQEADEVLKEMHDGVCGAHQTGPKLQDRIRRMGYYWPTMVKDAMEYARRCEACQFHANFIHQAPEPLHPTVASWPFEAWGMDIIGPRNPPSSNGHRFILTVTDYFSKWAEAIALAEVKTAAVLKFLKTNVICRFGVPKRFIHDNGPQFRDHRFHRFCEIQDR